MVTGCLAERYRDTLQQEIPEIDALLGTGDVPTSSRPSNPAQPAPAERRLPVTFYRRDSVAGHRDAGRSDGVAKRDARDPLAASRQPLAAGPQPLAPSPEPLSLAWTCPPTSTTRPRHAASPRPGHYAYVKIAEGCDYSCAFCVIPKMRGHYRSRTVESVVAEATALAARGVKELLLVSQDTTFYGIDRKERDALPRLIRALDAVDGIEWVRLLYLYPTTITDATIDAIAASTKVVRYIDLPLQHASDPVLKRMKRPGTRASYERLLRNIRAKMPDVTLRTTFIVGFPGETEADVDELLVVHHGRSASTTSASSPTATRKTPRPSRWSTTCLPPRRPAASGRSWPPQKKLVAARQKARIGARARLVVDGPSPEHEWVFTGRLPGQAPEIDPQVYLTEADPAALHPGQFLDVENRRRDAATISSPGHWTSGQPNAKVKGPVLIWEIQSGLKPTLFCFWVVG